MRRDLSLQMRPVARAIADGAWAAASVDDGAATDQNIPGHDGLRGRASIPNHLGGTI